VPPPVAASEVAWWSSEAGAAGLGIAFLAGKLGWAPILPLHSNYFNVSRGTSEI
jgi:hypothetical protein